MRLIKIPKKTKGAFREICSPSADEKNKLRGFLANLNKKAQTLCDPDVVQGFMLGKSPVTNAMKHVGFAYTLKFDLANFFDTVTIDHLKGKLSKDEIKGVFWNGRTYQGMPTSPIVANIAAKDLDDAILRLIKKSGVNIIYTRYADDMCFSFDDFTANTLLRTHIPQIVGRCGFVLNKTKTWLQDARYGKRHITGVMVDESSISASRSVRRRLRAAKHQQNMPQVHGLQEWVKLKTPSPEKKIRQSDMNILTRQWKLPRVYLNRLPTKPYEEEFEYESEKILVTGDPVQVLGLSNFTTNWTSCMQHPSGLYHRLAPFWLHLEGTYIAGILSDDTKTFGGFTRPIFKARALVHFTDDGRKIIDRLYGESYDRQEQLYRALQSRGYIDSRARNGSLTTIIGSVNIHHVPNLPYLDTLHSCRESNTFRLYTFC